MSLSPSFGLIGFDDQALDDFDWLQDFSPFAGFGPASEGHGFTDPPVFPQLSHHATVSEPITPFSIANCLQPSISRNILTLDANDSLLSSTQNVARFNDHSMHWREEAQKPLIHTQRTSQVTTNASVSLNRRQYVRSSRSPKTRPPRAVDESLRCKQCHRLFTRKPDLSRHIQSIHEKGIELFCPISTCKKLTKGHGFKRKDNLDKHHQRMHVFLTDELISDDVGDGTGTNEFSNGDQS
jgi:uncharacterized Zn-finger protein